MKCFGFLIDEEVFAVAVKITTYLLWDIYCFGDQRRQKTDFLLNGLMDKGGCLPYSLVDDPFWVGLRNS